jgi:hypothetical protein
MKSPKLIVEVTAKGRKRTLHLDGKVYHDEMLRTEFGMKGTGKCIEDQLGQCEDDLWYALSEADDNMDLVKVFEAIESD